MKRRPDSVPVPERRRPFVVINMAMTADGKINTAGRTVPGFGSDRDLDHLYRLRAGADAILCGARTVEQSRAVLDHGPAKYGRLRVRQGRPRPALRVVVSGRGTLAADAPIWSYRGAPLIVVTAGGLPRDRRSRLARDADELWESPRGRIDWPEVLDRLYRLHGVRRLLVEGGGEINFTLLAGGWVDEIHLTVCPRVFGGRTAPTIADGPGFPGLADAPRLERVRCRRAGDELFLVYRIRPEPKPEPRA